VVCRVSLLKAGCLSRDESGKILDARSSVSLIVSGQRKILVDTGPKGEEEIIIEALAQKGLEATDIDTLINTHSHIDHIGNNHLFSRATLIFPREGDRIAPGVKIMVTPGHSRDSISVVVDSRQVIVLAGDALPTFSNYIKMVPPALHTNRELAISSMFKILKIADVVVPGHDSPFSISKRAYIELWDQCI
jgi:glyoxylase-like metal-dependent hydrolase (beta-lactamase superfamily II)